MKVTKTKTGSTVYTKGNKIHREDGPAIIDFDGGKTWMIEGTRHRIGGPAITETDGTKEYWVRGKLIAYSLPSPWKNWITSIIYDHT